jgi:hypothetical protein
LRIEVEVFSTSSKTGISHEYGFSISSLRQRMIEDMNARKLCAGTQRGHVRSCKQFAAFLKRSLDTATSEDIRRFQLHLAESGASICNRNRIMTGLRFLFRVTLRRLDLAAEIYHIREPQKIPLVMSPDETKRLLAVAQNLKVRVLLSLGYGCGLRSGEVVRLKVKHIDSAQKIIRIEQSKGRKDRNSTESTHREPARPAVAAAQEASKEQERPVAGVAVGGDVASAAGGRGYFPRPWTGMAPSQCRPCQPRPTQSDGGDRELLHSSARRPYRALRERELRLHADRL